MGITFTLIVQAGNFLIAYGIIRYLIFKPLVSLIMAEKARHDGLIHAVRQSQERQVAQERAMGDLWKSCRGQFNAVSPLLEKHVDHIVVEPIKSEKQLTAQAEDGLVKDATAELVQRIFE